MVSRDRLEDLRQKRDGIRRQIYAMYGLSYEEDIADAVDEIDRLTEVLRDIAYNTSSSVPLGQWPVDHYRWMMHRAVSLAANALEENS